MKDRQNYQSFIFIIIILILFLFSSFFKVRLTKHSPYYDSKDETRLFWSEGATQYRYAKMVAEGQKIPELDLAIQYPEGIKTFEELTTLMERTSGYIYRLLFSKFHIPFHIFAIYFISFFSSFSLFAVYLTSKEIWQNNWSALISSIFYAVSRPMFDRSVHSFEHENFVLPFLFFGFYFFLKSIKAKKIRYNASYALLTGLCLLVALSSWHLTRFYFTVFMVCLAVLFFVNFDKYRLLGRSFIIMSLFVLISSITVPVLRSKTFFASTPMIISYALFLVYLLRRYVNIDWNRAKGIFVFFVVLSVFLLINYFILGAEQYEYSHVYSLIKYKLLCFGQKPSDPTKLPLGVRYMWIEAFNSPTLGRVIFSFSTILFLSIILLAVSIRQLVKKNFQMDEEFLYYAALSFFGLYLLFQRLEVFLIFFLTIFIGKLIKLTSNFSRAKSVSFFVLLMISFVFEAQETIQLGKETFFRKVIDKISPIIEQKFPLSSPFAARELVKWIKNNTDKDAVFIASFSASALITTYAERLTVLHPKFEAKNIRGKFEKFVTALYGNEDLFYETCKQFKADYFLYENRLLLDNSKDSYRYSTDNVQIRKDNPIFKFHFRPKELNHFLLLYQNHTFRVFKILDENEKSYPAIHSGDIVYEPVFDINVFIPESSGIQQPYFDDSRVPNTLFKIQTLAEYTIQGNEFIKNREYKTALRWFSDAEKLGIRDPRISYGIGQCYFYLGLLSESMDSFKKCLDRDPNFSGAYGGLAAVYLLKGEHNKSLEECKKAIELAPYESRNYNTLGLIYVEKGMVQESILSFERALALDPDNEIARKNLYDAVRRNKQRIK